MRVHVSELKSGDQLLEDTFNSFGLHVLSANTVLSEGDIAKLFNHHIDYVEIARMVQIQAELNLDRVSKAIKNKFQPAYVDAVEGIKHLFAQALQKGTLNMKESDEAITPLLDHCFHETDVVSLLLCLNTKDDYTYQHSAQVGMISFYLAKWLGAGDDEAYQAGKAGFLHDIGKSKINDAILRKPGRLTDEEYEEIKKHSVYGYEILKSSIGETPVALAALQHHERMDGTGYPYGHPGPELGALSKIVAVADVYSAMISKRVYQDERDLLTVLQELDNSSYTELDPKFTQVFINNMMPHFLGKRVLLNTGETGQVIYTNPSDKFRPLIRVQDRFYDLSHEPGIRIDKVL